MEHNYIGGLRYLMPLHAENRMSIDIILKHLAEEDLYGAFLYVEKGYRFPILKWVFEYLPDEKKYKLFTDLYSDAESGFECITKKMTDKIKRLRPQEIIDSLIAKSGLNGILTIYRGSRSNSRPVEKAISWTLDYNKAVWFARRFDFDDSACVYTATAKVKDVIAYIQNREEEEILIRYKDLQVVSKDEVTVNKKLA